MVHRHNGENNSQFRRSGHTGHLSSQSHSDITSCWYNNEFKFEVFFIITSVQFNWINNFFILIFAYWKGNIFYKFVSKAIQTSNKSTMGLQLETGDLLLILVFYMPNEPDGSHSKLQYNTKLAPLPYKEWMACQTPFLNMLRHGIFISIVTHLIQSKYLYFDSNLTDDYYFESYYYIITDDIESLVLIYIDILSNCLNQWWYSLIHPWDNLLQFVSPLFKTHPEGCMKMSVW